MATHVRPRRALAAHTPYPPPVSCPTFARHDPRQEPGAVVPHTGICTGGQPVRVVPTATFYPEAQSGSTAHPFLQSGLMGFQEQDDAARREVGLEMAGHLQYDPPDRMWNAVQWSSLGARCDLIARMGTCGNSRQASGFLPTSLGTGSRSRHLPDRGSDREYRS